MARRTSTRFRIRERGVQIKNNIKHMYENFQAIDTMADNKSEYLNKTLPVMIQFLAEYEKTFDRFFEEL